MLISPSYFRFIIPLTAEIYLLILSLEKKVLSFHQDAISNGYEGSLITSEPL